MTQHTPGPWEAQIFPHDDADFAIWKVGVRLALVDSRPNDKNMKESRANARLIAKAPEMLTALKHLRAAVDTLSDEVTHQRAAKWGIVNNALVEACALLREIEGES